MAQKVTKRKKPVRGDVYRVTFKLGRKQSQRVIRAENEWMALYQVSRRHGKKFRVVTVEFKSEFYGWQEKIGCCATCHQPTGIGSHPSCPHGRLSQAYAQRFAPVVVHVDAHGNTRFPGRADAPVPAGFERRELRTIPEVRSFERNFNLHEKVRMEQHFEKRERSFQEAQAERRKELRSAMEGMSNRGRDFAQFAMDVNNQRRKRTAGEPGCHFEVFEMDASNRAPHNDRDTGWRDRK